MAGRCRRKIRASLVLHSGPVDLRTGGFLLRRHTGGFDKKVTSPANGGVSCARSRARESKWPWAPRTINALHRPTANVERREAGDHRSKILRPLPGAGSDLMRAWGGDRGLGAASAATVPPHLMPCITGRSFLPPCTCSFPMRRAALDSEPGCI